MLARGRCRGGADSRMSVTRAGSSQWRRAAFSFSARAAAVRSPGRCGGTGVRLSAALRANHV
jgi:hypothetical protein